MAHESGRNDEKRDEAAREGAPAPPTKREALPSGGWTVLPGVNETEEIIDGLELEELPSAEEADELLEGTFGEPLEEQAMADDAFDASAMDLLERGVTRDGASDPGGQAHLGDANAQSILDLGLEDIVEPLGDAELLDDLDLMEGDEPVDLEAPTYDRVAPETSTSSSSADELVAARPAPRYPIKVRAGIRPPEERDARTFAHEPAVGRPPGRVDANEQGGFGMPVEEEPVRATEPLRIPTLAPRPSATAGPSAGSGGASAPTKERGGPRGAATSADGAGANDADHAGGSAMDVGTQDEANAAPPSEVMTADVGDAAELAPDGGGAAELAADVGDAAERAADVGDAAELAAEGNDAGVRAAVGQDAAVADDNGPNAAGEGAGGLDAADLDAWDAPDVDADDASLAWSPSERITAVSTSATVVASGKAPASPTPSAASLQVTADVTALPPEVLAASRRGDSGMVPAASDGPSTVEVDEALAAEEHETDGERSGGVFAAATGPQQIAAADKGEAAELMPTLQPIDAEDADGAPDTPSTVQTPTPLASAVTSTPASPKEEPSRVDTRPMRSVAPSGAGARTTTERSVLPDEGDRSIAPFADEPLRLTVPAVDGGVPEGRNTWFGRQEVFRSYTQGLARMGRWSQIAAVTAHAAAHASWATGSVRASLLLELGRLYRDRVDDPLLAEEAFSAVLQADPGNVEATTWLLDAARSRGDWRAVVARLLASADATWDAAQRLQATMEAAEIAQHQLGDESLVADCWERLWKSGDASQIAVRELARALRRARRWKDLAGVLRRRMEGAPPAFVEMLQLELVPVVSEGLDDAEGAVELLDAIEQGLGASPSLVAERIEGLIRRRDHAGLEAIADRLREPASLRRVADALWREGQRAAAARIDGRLRSEGHADDELYDRLDAWYASSNAPKARLDLLVERAASTAPARERAAYLTAAIDLCEERLDDEPRAMELLDELAAVEGERAATWARRARLARALGRRDEEIASIRGVLRHRPDRDERLLLHRRLAELLAADAERVEEARAEAERAVGLAPRDPSLWELVSSLDVPVAPAETRSLRWRARVHAAAPGAAVRPVVSQAWQDLQEAELSDAESLEWLGQVVARDGAERTAAEGLAAWYRERSVPTSEALWLEIATWDAQGAGGPDAQRLRALARQECFADDRLATHALHEASVVAAGGDDEAVLRLADELASRGDVIAARALVEASLVRSTDQDARVRLLRVLERWIPESDPVGLEEHLRRRDRMGCTEAFDALYSLAERTGDWTSVIERLQARALRATSDAERRDVFMTIASILLRMEEGGVRAWCALQAAISAPEGAPDVLDTLRELAPTTGRFEDLLALLDALASRTDDPTERRERILERACICRDDIQDSGRAFAEFRRLVELDPQDAEAMAGLRSAATTPALRRRYRSVLQHVDDARSAATGASPDLVSRIALARTDGDADEAAVLEQLRLRLALPTPEGLTAVLGDEEGAWEGVMPLVEGMLLGRPSDAHASDLAWLASNWERRAAHPTRSIHLLALSLLAEPALLHASDDLRIENVARLAASHGRASDGSIVLRAAAHRAKTSARAETLLCAALALEPREETRVAIHRELVDVLPTRTASLRMLADWASGLPWPALRLAYLEAWESSATSDSERIEALDAMAGWAWTRIEDESLTLALHLRRSALVADAGHDAELDRIASEAKSPDVRMRVLERRLDETDGEQRRTTATRLARLYDDAGQRERALACWTIVADEEGVLSEAAMRVAELRASMGDRGAALALEADRYVASVAAAPAGRGEEGIDLLRRLRTHGGHPAQRAGAVIGALARVLEPAGDRLASLVMRGALARDESWDAWLATFGAMPTSGWERRLKARVLWHCVGRGDDAVAIWTAIASDDPAGGHLFLAFEAAGAGRWDAWIDHRIRAARALPDALAAVALCFVAEALGDLATREGVTSTVDVAELYREARRLDSSLVPAQEALRAIGRRLRSLRPAAALLPMEGEEDMSWVERARVMEARARSASDALEALDWARRAAMTGADLPELWELLADMASAVGRRDEASIARRLAWEARERTVRPHADVLAEESRALLSLAAALRAADDAEAADAIVREAAALSTTSAEALLACLTSPSCAMSADEVTLRVEMVLAHAARDASRADSVSIDCARLLALRAMMTAETERAQADLEEALRWDRCNPSACAALARARGRSGERLRWLAHALAFESDGATRIELYRELADLVPGSHRGATRELAWSEGDESRETLREVLHHHQATGRAGEAIGIVDALIESESDSGTLARLWATRGTIVASDPQAEEQAIEAFDMALSYDPSSTDARLGLAGIFERRQDWEQLLPLLEVMVESTPDEERASVLRRIGSIALGIPGEEARGEAALREAVAIEPDRASVALLEERERARDPRSPERMQLLAHLVAFGPPWYSVAMEVGQLALDSAPRLAWSLLSPVLMTRGVDDELKNRLRDMRREHERPPILVIPEALRDAHAGAESLRSLRAWFTRFVDDARLVPQSLTDAGIDEPVEVSRLSSVGRQFASLAEQMGVADAVLVRGGLRGSALRVVEGADGLRVVIRSDLFQQMARAEVGFLLAAAAEAASATHRGVSRLGPDGTFDVVRALWVHTGLGDAETMQGSGGVLARVGAALPDDELPRVRALLSGVGSDPVRVATSLVDGTRRACWRAGFVAGADIYQVMRLFGRIEEDPERTSLFSSVEQIDEVLQVSPDVRDLLAFASTPAFARALNEAAEIGV